MAFYRQIEIFRAVMMSTSLAEASARLLISQPAISKQLKNLEAYLGVQLFDREGHRLSPTSHAKDLFDKSSLPIEAVKDLDRYARSIGQHGSHNLHITVMPMVAKLWLPGRLARVMETLPSVKVSVNVGQSAEVIEMVEAGKTDIGIALPIRPVGAAQNILLLKNRAVFICPHDHPLASKEVITPEDLKEENFFLLGPQSFTREHILSAFDQHEIGPRIRGEIDVEDVVVPLVEQGAGVAIIDEYSAVIRIRNGARIRSRPFVPFIAMDIHLFVSFRRGDAAMLQHVIDELIRPED